MSRLVRVAVDGASYWAEVQGDSLVPPPVHPWMYDPPIRSAVTASSVRLLPPAQPSKVIAVLGNIGPPVVENEVTYTLKPPSTLVADGDAVRRPTGCMQLRPEAEVAVMVGKTLRNAGREESRAAIAGVTCANDLTALDFFLRDKIAWGRAKGFDTFTPLGPCLMTDIDPGDLEFSLRVNDEVRYTARTSQLNVGAVDVLAQISAISTLAPGDVVLLGSPGEGPGVTEPGDVLTAWVEGVGLLRNPVLSSID